MEEGFIPYVPLHLRHFLMADRLLPLRGEDEPACV
jgi:hypothetical protein